MANKLHLQEKQISQRAVRLLFKVWAGYQPIHDITYYLEYMSLHLPTERLEPALEWLISKGITGKLFAEFIEQQCAGSALELIKQVTKGIEKTRETRAIMAKDLKLT
jgi:hypothetical protein